MVDLISDNMHLVQGRAKEKETICLKIVCMYFDIHYYNI